MVCAFAGTYFIYRSRCAQTEEERVRMIEYHAICMIGLFLGACGTPAVMRLAGTLGLPFTVGLPVFGVLLVLGVIPMKRAIYAQRWV